MKHFAFILLILSAGAHASFYMDYKLNYQTETDAGDGESFQYNRMMNSLYFAASMDRKKQLYIGQSIISWNKSQKQGESSEEFNLKLLELGPRIHFYLTQAKTWYTSLTYNFYAKGTSSLEGTEGDVSGTGYVANIGYHYKLSRSVGIGGSLNFHSVTITERKVDSTTSDVSETYNAIVPMLELAFRFR